MNIWLRTLLLAWSIFACASARATDRRLEHFDAHAGGTLPTHFVLPDTHGQDRRIDLIRRFRSDIRVNDQPAAMFEARIDGRPGSIVRHGDSLDITLDDEESAASGGPGPIDYEPAPADAAEPFPARRPLARVAPRAGPDEESGISVWLFLHRDAEEYDRGKVLNWYANWWLKDMETTVTPDVPIHIWVVENAAGITDMDYHAGTIHERMAEVARRGADFASSSGESVTSLYKFVLLVGKPAANWGPDAKGVAIAAYNAAMISNEGPRFVLAHELGHLLGARHEASEARFLCDTNMVPQASRPFPCMVYTKANDENIRQYVHSRLGR